MNRNKVLELAREADLYMTSDERIAAVERFVALIELELREKHARLCSSIAPSKREFDERLYDICYVCADVIRSDE